MITYAELCEKLKSLDETTLMELLELHADDLVERCKDIIEENYDYIIAQFEEEEYDEQLR